MQQQHMPAISSVAVSTWCRVDVWWVGDSVNVGTEVLSWTIVLALDGLNIGSFDGGILG